MSDEREADPKRALAFSETLPGTSGETTTGTLPAATERTDTTPGLTVPPEEGALPHRIGRYTVLRQLGEGGMGVVYSGYDEELDRRVALKLVRQQGAEGSPEIARVLQEAQAMARLSHPNIAQVYEVGRDAPSGRIFISMEYIAGISLRDHQQQVPLDSARALDKHLQLYLQAAAGLAAAHHSGLIHRDFKPENVLVGTDGRVRVVDFGLARALDRGAVAEGEGPSPGFTASGRRLTHFGAILGTPGYMAPEQVRGEEADARSDQFSFCVALFESLFGELPFGGDTFEEFSANLLQGRLRAPTRRDDALEVPLAIEQALRRGLSMDPAARFPSMAELITALSAGLLPDADSENSLRRKHRYRDTGIAMMLLLIAVHMAGRRTEAQVTQRSSLMMALASGVVFAIILIALRKIIAKQPATRRQMIFFSTAFLYVIGSRAFALLLHIPLLHEAVLEQVGLATLFAGHALVVGARYLVLPLVSLGAIVALLLVPSERGLWLNLTFALLAFLGVYLYPQDQKPSVRPRPSSPTRTRLAADR